MNIARTYELSQKHLKSMNAGEDPNVYAVKSKYPTKQRPSNKTHNTRSFSEKPKHDTHAVKCMKCGYNHAEKPCPALGKKCRYCQKMNHFSKMCLARKRKHDRQRKGVNSLEDYDNDSTSSDYSDYDSCGSDLVYVKMLSDEQEITRKSYHACQMLTYSVKWIAHPDFGNWNWTTKAPNYVPSTLHSGNIATLDCHLE